MSVRGFAIKAAATVAVAGGLTIGTASMASADYADGWIAYDNGTQCSVIVQTADGAWVDWYLVAQ